MDRLTPEQRYKNMVANKSKGTKPEIALGKILWEAGIRYRKNVKTVFGHPDFVVKKFKMAIFCDGEFWHGRDWERRRKEHKSNRDFWYKKIEGNIDRDQKVNEVLRAEGWKVLRFWETEIRKEPDECLRKVLNVMATTKNGVDQLSLHLPERGFSAKAGFVPKFDSLIQRKIPLKAKNATKIKKFVLSEDQKAVLTHYFHNKGTPFENNYLKEAAELLLDTALNNEDQAIRNLIEEVRQAPFVTKTRPKFTFIDLFAGIGGFRIALQDLGGKCVFSSEWDTAAQRTYFLNYGEVPFGDITLERTKELIPDGFDVLCAGFPCQAFSLAGHRKGFEEARGTLFFDVADILHRRRPKAFFLENVKGLMIHDKGKTIDTILKILREDLDYYVPDPQIVNAKDFGVPQNRERVYIVGFRKDIVKGKKFRYPKPLKSRPTIADIKESEVVSTKYYLSTQYLKSLIEHRRRHEAAGHGFGYEIISDDKIANAIVVGGMGRERNLIIDNRLTDFTPVTRIKGEVNREGIRRMTPREWARLQGFPDEFIIGVADASAYKQFGNSVAVSAIRATAKKLLQCLDIVS